MTAIVIPFLLTSSSLFFSNFPKKHVLNWISEEVHKYSVSFASVYQKHLEGEFEVSARMGSVTEDGLATLDQLQDEFYILQFEERLSNIIHETQDFNNIKPGSTISALLDVVLNDVLDSFKEMIRKIQAKTALKRRCHENAVCKQKCNAGITLHNFTDVTLPAPLLELLSSGLNNVPKLDTSQMVQ